MSAPAQPDSPQRRPELLAPAGNLKNLRYALAYGADAVYAGVPRYSLRVRNNDFDLDNLAVGIALTRERGRRFYLAANVMPHGAKLKTFVDDMAPVIELAPNALIMADPGLILLVRERWPDVEVHLSVQANTTNAAAVRFWQTQGISRVILSRELSLAEIAEIRAACPDVELEVFVHGALCIAYSGRCLLSGYFNRRDANQGTCTNACRWEYRVAGADGQSADVLPTNQSTGTVAIAANELLDAPAADAMQRHPAADEVWLLEEAQRPGEYMPVFEDENGTYIMNAKDLRAVEHVQQLAAMGIDCLKIEGRTKSHYYAARTTQVYRQAIDDAVAGRPFRRDLLTDLEGLANRGYTEGFYRRHAPAELQSYDDGASRNQRRIFVGEVISHDPASGLSEIDVKNRFGIDDELELMTPRGSVRFRLDALMALDGGPLDAALGSGWRVLARLPTADPTLGLITRAL
ncbi:MAG: tRNA 5-hydroxyuridine modification protein YegQ [Thiohalocapsa sp.]